MSEFWDWWQHLPQHISPVIFEIGWFRLQYYGLMYIVAFAFTYFLVLYRIRHEKRFGFSKNQVNDLTTYAIVGLIIGARLAMYCSTIYPITCAIRSRFFYPFRFQTVLPLPASRACHIMVALSEYCWPSPGMSAKPKLTTGK